MRDTIINDWLARLEAQEPGSREHAGRVAVYAMALGQKLGLSSEDVQQLRWGMLLHDIGKLGVPDAIIRFPGKLTAKEWAFVIQHPTLGDNMLADVEGTELLRTAVRCHHERWDGDGYPNGLKGPAIPLFGRIAAICDSWDVMLTDRAYKPAMTVAEAVAELRRCSGTQFDPILITLFLSMSHRLVDIPSFVEHYI